MGLRSLIFPAFLASSFYCFAQDSTMFIVVEGGGSFMACESDDRSYIRADSRPTTIFDPKIAHEFMLAFAGVKLEKITKDERFGFSAGLRFTSLRSAVVKRGLPDFYFFRYDQTETTTEYLRVHKLEETSLYLGVPAEVRWYRSKEKRMRWFFLIGWEWNYQLRTRMNAEFSDPTMEMYEAGVQDIVGKPDSWYANFYLGAGLLLATQDPRFGLGITIPSVMTKGVSSLNTPQGGFGLQFTYLLPAKRKRI